MVGLDEEPMERRSMPAAVDGPADAGFDMVAEEVPFARKVCKGGYDGMEFPKNS